MMERKPILPKPAESFSQQEEAFFNSPANPDTLRPAEDPFKADDGKVDTELTSTNEEAFIESPASRGEFSNDEKQFFDETEEESLFEKSAAELNQSILEQKIMDDNALVTAQENLALVSEDEESKKVEAFPTKQPKPFNELEEKFFAAGDAMGADSDQDDNSGAEERMAS